jgi:tetratricopeptide (TPR) repeat protein
MRSRFCPLAVLLLFATLGVAQMQPVPQSGSDPGNNQLPPRSDQGPGPDQTSDESSSRETKIDLSPPPDDAKNHPDSAAAVSAGESDSSDVTEFHPWNPHQAAKDEEVGDFYFRRKNYRAALARYQDALVWKNTDAIANFRIAQCFEKLQDPEEAANHYEQYLKILPHGPLSGEAQKALGRLKAKTSAADAAARESAP